MQHESVAYQTISGQATAEIEEKKSRFIAHVAHVETEEEALSFLEGVRSAHRMARHNVYAYVLRSADGNGTGGERVRYSDDGEPQKTAGLPTLEVIRHESLTDIIVVVTRYFGGTLLGTGGLVRAYTQATQASIEAAERVVVSQCVDITIKAPYALYEQVNRLCLQHEAKVVSTDFADEVTLSVRVLNGGQSALVESLVELMRGSSGIQVSEPFDAAF